MKCEVRTPEMRKTINILIGLYLLIAVSCHTKTNSRINQSVKSKKIEGALAFS